MVMKFVLHDRSMIGECDNVFWDEDNMKNLEENIEKGPSSTYAGWGP